MPGPQRAPIKRDYSKIAVRDDSLEYAHEFIDALVDSERNNIVLMNVYTSSDDFAQPEITDPNASIDYSGFDTHHDRNVFVLNAVFEDEDIFDAGESRDKNTAALRLAQHIESTENGKLKAIIEAEVFTTDQFNGRGMGRFIVWNVIEGIISLD